jgi:hypothetical protein
VSVRIEEINIQQLGPIANFSMTLGSVNLVYGRNESGKTYLVEFIINSLFKNPQAWNIRQANASGRIIISGLEDRPTAFTPLGRRKLDEDWLTRERNLHPSLSRLLVIKAGEVWLAKDHPAGVDHMALKEFLSNSAVIDKIKDGIYSSTRSAEIVNQDINGSNVGDIKKRNETKENLERIDQWFERLNQEYSSGELASLNHRLRIKQGELDAEWRARCGAAFRLDQELQKLRKEIDELPEEEIEELSDEIRNYGYKEEHAEKVRRSYLEKKAQGDQYEWLERAVGEYESRSAAVRLKISWIWPGSIILIGLLSLVFLYHGDALLTGLAILVLLILGWVYHYQTKEMVKRAINIKELENLATEYEQRIGEKLRDVATLKAMRDEQKRNADFAVEKEKELNQLQNELSQNESRISNIVYQLAGKNVSKEEWERTIWSLKKRLRDLRADRSNKDLALTRLGVDPQDYLAAAVDLHHDEENYLKLEGEFKELKAQRDEKEQDLVNLKHSISGFLDVDISTDWEILIEKIQEERQEGAKNYCAITARVLAGVLVNQELERLAEREDERIREGLRSDLVLAPLKQLTRRYDQIDMEKGHLLLSGSHGSFRLSDMSTGAQEQVLLALRMGFAAKHLGQKRMFLIMDDAFQHADWQRREYLVEQAVELENSGWQILYLTMDDHIRDLFKKIFGERLVYKELGGND